MYIKRPEITLRKIIIAFIILIAIVYGYLSIFSFDITHKIPELRTKIKANLYGDINADNLSIIFLPRPRIYASNFTLSSKGAPVIEARNMRATIKLLPLIKKKIIIKELIFTDADLFILKRRDGTTNLKEVRKEKLLDIRLRGAKLIDSTIRLVHELPHETFRFELTEVSAKLYPASKGFAYIVDGVGSNNSIINISGGASKTKDGWRLGGTMSAQRLKSSLFTPYARLLDPDMDIHGTIKTDIDFSYHKRATIKGKVSYQGLSAEMPKYNIVGVHSDSGHATLDLNASKGELSLSLNDAELKMDGFDLSGSFNLKGPPGERLMHLSLSSTLGDYLKIKRFVPYKLFAKTVKERIEKFNVKAGKVRIEELKFNAPISELKGKTLLKDSESFTMKLDFEGFEFKYPNFNDIYSNIWGKLVFEGGDIALEGFNGLYGDARIEKLDGEITGLAKKVSYKINISSSFDLETSLSELKRLTKGKLDKLKGSGPVSLTLQINGSSKAKLNYLGKIIFLGDSISHSSIPIDMFTSTKGSVGFEKNMLVFNDINAMSGGSNLTLNGTVEGLTEKEPVYNLNLKGALESVGLNSLIKSKGAKPITYNNLMYYKISVKGKKDDLTVKSIFNLTDIELAYKGILKKMRSFPVFIKVEANVKRDETNINKATFNIGSSNITMTGKVNHKKHAYEFSIPGTRFNVKDLDNILVALKDDEWASGFIDLTLKAKKSNKSKKTLLNGEISLADGFLSTTVLEKRLENVSFKARFKDNTGDISVENVTIGKSSASAEVTIKDLNKRVIEFEVNSESLSTKDISTNKDRPKGVKKRGTLTGKGRINIKKGYLGKHPFKAFKTNVKLNKNSFDINPLIFSMHEGLVTGKASIMRDPKSNQLYTTRLEVRNFDLEPLTKKLKKDKNTISGRLDADVTLFGKRGMTIEDGLNGTIKIISKNGKLWKFPIITKIFSLINIISINNLFESGLEYKEISGFFNIKDSVFSTENLLFDSSSLRMSAHGEINYPKYTIDAALGLHPFVTVDKIINLIPLAGYLISGKDKSAITMYYEIKGPLKKPDIHAVPIKSLGKGIFGILERTMKLPGQVLTPDTTNKNKMKDGGSKEPGAREPATITP